MQLLRKQNKSIFLALQAVPTSSFVKVAIVSFVLASSVLTVFRGDGGCIFAAGTRTVLLDKVLVGKPTLSHQLQVDAQTLPFWTAVLDVGRTFLDLFDRIYY